MSFPLRYRSVSAATLCAMQFACVDDVDTSLFTSDADADAQDVVPPGDTDAASESDSVGPLDTDVPVDTPVAPSCAPGCVNGGVCVATDICDCMGTGYSGAACTTPVCEPACENGGACLTPNGCVCSLGWVGPRCDTPVCSTPCENGGDVSRPTPVAAPKVGLGPSAVLRSVIHHV